MIKNILILSGMFCLTACGSSNSNSGGGSPAANYAACEQLPSGSAVTQNPCPGAVGTWNNYEVVKNSAGNVTSFKLWCGGTDGDHPATQMDYDSYMIPGGNTSGADYVVHSDCASGSSEDVLNKQTFNIWQKVK